MARCGHLAGKLWKSRDFRSRLVTWIAAGFFLDASQIFSASHRIECAIALVVLLGRLQAPSVTGAIGDQSRPSAADRANLARGHSSDQCEIRHVAGHHRAGGHQRLERRSSSEGWGVPLRRGPSLVLALFVAGGELLATRS